MKMGYECVPTRVGPLTYGGGVADAHSGGAGYRFEDGEPVPPPWFRIAARLRGPALTAGYVGVITGVLTRVFSITSDDAALSVLVLGCVLLALSVALGSSLGTPQIAARPVGVPVRGRWRAFNSPANRVPSHGTHGYG